MSRTSRLVVLILVAGGGLAVAVWALALRHAPVEAPEQVVRSDVTPDASVADTLFPGRPARLERAGAPPDTDWVGAPPSARFQYSRPTSERGGVAPCAAAAPSPAGTVFPLSRGHWFAASENPLDAEGHFDLIIHLHGEAPIRRELVESGTPFVLYTLTLPTSESYAPLFAGSGLLGRLIDEITTATGKHYGNAHASVRHLALSAWSAGYEGVRSILHQPEADRARAVLLIDGLHAPRKGDALAKHMNPFVRFARRAQRGERFFVLTHSSIPTADYTSTTESAHFLIDALGGRPSSVERDDGFGLELVELFTSGDANVRGYAGNDKADHCAQLYLMRSLFTALHRTLHPE
jgi:hypothetical protein